MPARGNFFQNMMSGVTQGVNVAAGGVGSMLSNVVGGVVGGVTAGVSGGGGIAGGTLQGGGAGDLINQVAGGQQGQSAATNILGSGAVADFAHNSSFNYGGGPRGGSGGATANDPSSFMGDIPKVDASGKPLVDPNTGQPVYAGFWSYWNKPKNYRFYVIWVGGVLFIVLALALFGVFSKPKPKKKKSSAGGSAIK